MYSFEVYIKDKEFRSLYDKSLDIYDLQLNLSDNLNRIKNKVVLIGIKEIDISYNCITYLETRTRVYNINVSHNEITEFLFDDNCCIINLDLSFNNLYKFIFENNDIEIDELNIADNKNLEKVLISGSSIRYLILKNNPKLFSITFNNSEIEDIILNIGLSIDFQGTSDVVSIS